MNLEVKGWKVIDQKAQEEIRAKVANMSLEQILTYHNDLSNAQLSEITSFLYDALSSRTRDEALEKLKRFDLNQDRQIILAILQYEMKRKTDEMMKQQKTWPRAKRYIRDKALDFVANIQGFYNKGIKPHLPYKKGFTIYFKVESDIGDCFERLEKAGIRGYSFNNSGDIVVPHTYRGSTDKAAKKVVEEVKKVLPEATFDRIELHK